MIKVNNLSLQIQKKDILSNINLQINPGIITTIVGANGCGKTTFIKCLANLIDIYSGAIYYNNKLIKFYSTAELARLVGWLDQSYSFAFNYKIIDIVIMGRYPWHQGYPSGFDRERSLLALAVFGLQDRCDDYIHCLSGGQKQAVLIARLLAGDQKILLLDEPTTHLDPQNAMKLYDHLSKIKYEKIIITTSHDYILLKYFSSAIISIASGEIKGLYKDSKIPSEFYSSLKDINVPKHYINQLL